MTKRKGVREAPGKEVWKNQYNSTALHMVLFLFFNLMKLQKFKILGSI